MKGAAGGSARPPACPNAGPYADLDAAEKAIRSILPPAWPYEVVIADLAARLDRAYRRAVPSSRKEDPIADWIPFSKQARYETIIAAARSVIQHVKRPPYDGGVAGLAHADLCEALAALDADWPKASPFTSHESKEKT